VEGFQYKILLRHPHTTAVNYIATFLASQVARRRDPLKQTDLCVGAQSPSSQALRCPASLAQKVVVTSAPACGTGTMPRGSPLPVIAPVRSRGYQVRLNTGRLVRHTYRNCGEEHVRKNADPFRVVLQQFPKTHLVHRGIMPYTYGGQV
jgi:hypothetical protein